jgi:hypothetical protein
LLESENLGTNPHPAHPQGIEKVRNTDNLCSHQPAAPSNEDQGGYFWCGWNVSRAGPGGGDPKQWWVRPFYRSWRQRPVQHLQQRFEPLRAGLCRGAVPRNARRFGGRRHIHRPCQIYCAGPADTNSCCNSLLGTEPDPGWFEVSGTSQAAPIRPSITADRDSYTGSHTADVNPLLYMLFNFASHPLPRHHRHRAGAAGCDQQRHVPYHIWL